MGGNRAGCTIIHGCQSDHLVKNQGLIQLKFMLKTPISGADAAVSSRRSVCTRATEMRYVYPLAFHTAREDGETDSIRQTCVPQPSASVPTRYHVVCYASQFSLAEWQQLGFDQHSVFSDPLFVNPAQNDFRVRPESPALKVGFKNFEMGNWGLTESFPERWKSRKRF